MVGNSFGTQSGICFPMETGKNSQRQTHVQSHDHASTQRRKLTSLFCARDAEDETTFVVRTAERQFVSGWMTYGISEHGSFRSLMAPSGPRYAVVQMSIQGHSVPSMSIQCVCSQRKFWLTGHRKYTSGRQEHYPKTVQEVSAVRMNDKLLSQRRTTSSTTPRWVIILPKRRSCPTTTEAMARRLVRL